MSDDIIADKKKINDFFKNDLFECLDQTGYLGIILYTNGKIPGFTRKNYYKAPKSMVKSIAKKQVKKVKDVKKFLTTYTKGHAQKYKGQSIYEYIVKSDLDASLTEGERIALFYLKFPYEYESFKDIIVQNKKQGRPLLYNIMDLSIKDKMKAILEMSSRNITEHIENEILSETTSPANTDLLDKSNSSLIDILNGQSLPGPGEYYYLELFTQFNNDVHKMENEEKSLFYQLVMQDIMLHYETALRSEKETKSKLKEELENQQVMLKQVEKQNRNKMSKLEQSLIEVKDELGNVKNKYTKAKSESTTEREKNKNILLDNERLEEQLTEIESKHKKAGQEIALLRKEKENITLFDNLNINLFTKENIAFASYFSQHQIVYFKNSAEFEYYLEQQNNVGMNFVNMDGVSTRETFLLEKLLKEKALNYRIVSGGASNVVKKIIYYLEGELRHEVKEKY